jgi:hypothetical protein
LTNRYTSAAGRHFTKILKNNSKSSPESPISWILNSLDYTNFVKFTKIHTYIFFTHINIIFDILFKYATKIATFHCKHYFIVQIHLLAPQKIIDSFGPAVRVRQNFFFGITLVVYGIWLTIASRENTVTIARYNWCIFYSS